MRQGQNGKRSRGRGRRQQNPANRSYESNGPDVKIRGNANTIVEKYLTLARDAQSSGDRITAENYLQHAEHYQRILNSFATNDRPDNRDAANRGDDQSDASDSDDDNSSGDDRQQTGAIKVADADAPQPDIPDDAHPVSANGGANGADDADGDDKPKRRTRRARKPKADDETGADTAADAKSDEPAEAAAG